MRGRKRPVRDRNWQPGDVVLVETHNGQTVNAVFVQTLDKETSQIRMRAPGSDRSKRLITIRTADILWKTKVN